LGVTYKGKTSIGVIFSGVKDGLQKDLMIYNVCDHAECFKETGAQAVSYTTGVPAMIGAKMVMTGKWSGKGVFNMEQFDPDPFMEDLNKYGLPWHVLHGKTIDN
jgi:saccharopine dehydrogenase (NAD+, L-lysine-forming)